ncbi:hypothetical protein [Chlorobium phaeovibrioides]|uniref:hypothetical protein n=1 Tax=Chlorobium phaeovibrioides TaxID=1094 RepID=UPI001CB9C5AB|nr:hypothetical protein [Chlorobium phaeovibrioides]
MNRRLLRLLLFLGFFFCDDARAGVFEVSLSSDDGDEHSLRGAVEQVNASADTDNVIRFTTETVTLSKALPVLTNNVAFEAPAGGVSVGGETGYNSGVLLWTTNATTSFPEREPMPQPDLQ